MPRLKLPTFTGRPRAVLRVDSIWGRKMLTVTRKGSAMAMTINRATTMPATLRAVFTTLPPGGRDPTRNEVNRRSESVYQKGQSLVASRWSFATRRVCHRLTTSDQRRYKIGAKDGIEFSRGSF